MAAQNVKLTVVGDGYIGKTCMVATYIQDEFPENVATGFTDAYKSSLIIDNKEISLEVWDTPGQEDFAK